jgi:hypothetical protein
VFSSIRRNSARQIRSAAKVLAEVRKVINRNDYGRRSQPAAVKPVSYESERRHAAKRFDAARRALQGHEEAGFFGK